MLKPVYGKARTQIPGAGWNASNASPEQAERLRAGTAELMKLEYAKANNGGTPNVVIPCVYPKFSNDRILTMDLIEGQRFYEFVREAPQASKDAFGALLCRIGVSGFLCHEFLNADRAMGCPYGCTKPKVVPMP